jgi:DNA (cytosine-5)-methyltransferase 1
MSEQLELFKLKNKENNFEDICNYLSNKILTPDEFGKHISNWAKNKDIQIKTLGLFSGAGGLDLGFEDVGFDISESVEIEDKFVASTRKNKELGTYFNNTNIKCIDIRDYKTTDIGNIDFVIGGPPCQSFSSAGRRAAGVRGTNDDRGTLFEEYVRILKELKPKGFLFENVYGILGAQNGAAIKQIVQAFRDVGYNLTYRILDAADYGVPQHRERLILVGLKNGEFRFPKPTHGPDSGYKKHFSAEEALTGCKIPSNINSQLNGRFGHLLKEIPTGLNYSFFTEKLGHPNPIFAWRSKFSDFLYKADPKMPIRTLKASGGQYTGPFHWESRKFTINELKRLQTFPDDYSLVGGYGTAMQQLGNSVPPQFARILALAVLDQVFNYPLPFELHYLEPNEALTFRKKKRERTKYYQEKAKTAINKIAKSNKIKISHEVYYVNLNAKFKFEVLKANNTRDKIEFIPSNNKWIIRHTSSEFDNKLKYNISIKQKNKIDSLFQNINEVILESNSLLEKSYAILWKSFEHHLNINKIKADLVQFNGYYQYKNKIDIKLVFDESISNDEYPFWHCLKSLNNDSIIGRIEPLEFYTNYFEKNNQDVISFFKGLRAIGFEVRNAQTNPDIPKNHYLIPYKFPTLTPLSVQLNKSL